MKKIDIRIDKAKILSYEVELKDNLPSITATIGLFSADKQISTFSLRTEEYYGNSIVITSNAVGTVSPGSAKKIPCIFYNGRLGKVPTR